MNKQLPIPLPFTNEIGLHARADRIRNLVNVARGCIIEIGRELIAAKAELRHGEWLPWLEHEFGWPARTAQGYMQVAEAFSQIRETRVFDGLTIDATALYALSAPDVPQPVRDEAVSRAEAGEHITKAQADQIIADAEQQFREKLTSIRDDAEAEAEAAIARAGKNFERTKAALEAEIQRLTEAGELPGVPEVVDALCKLTGQPKLTPKQFGLVAQVLNTSVTDGHRVYQPVPEETVKRMEVDLQISGAMVRALEYFAGAPDPAEAWRACPKPLRDAAKRNAQTATDWLKRFHALLKMED
jgi:hypothetical protein